MTKKNYIEPSIIVKTVNIGTVMQVSAGEVPVDNNDDDWGDDGFNSKQTLTINDVWED